MRKYLLILMGFVLILISCVGDIQDIPPQFQSDPIFFGQVKIGGENVELQAGSNGYIMNSTNFVDSTDGVIFRSSIEPENCAGNCGPRIWFEFVANNPVAQAPENVVSTFQEGTKEYGHPYTAEDSFDITFTAITEEGFGSFVFWEGLAGGIVPGTDYSLTTLGSEAISACLHSISTDSCFGIKCVQMIPSASPDGCNVNLKASRANENYVLLEATPEGVGPFSYVWTTGETSSKILLPLPINGVSVVDLEVTDATGCVSFIQQKINSTGAGIHACPIDYNFNLEHIPAQEIIQSGTVRIYYQNQEGIIYSTAFGSQSGNQFFEITSVEDFEMTPQGDLSKKIDIRFQADLFQEQVDSPIRLELGEFTIAVAY